ncbi:hypothetical protein SSAG_01872 [Streptomyces sp. Mg1]|nr:hypothetical protein SSAG_01872 [Streptomyces sp. Mg1]
MRTPSGGHARAWIRAELEEHLETVGRELLRQLLQGPPVLRVVREEDQLPADAALSPPAGRHSTPTTSARSHSRSSSADECRRRSGRRAGAGWRLGSGGSQS